MSWKYVQRNDESGQYRTTDEGGGGGGSSTFAGLNDVVFSNLQDGQIPKYNSSTGKWENEDESGGTVTDVQVDGTSVVDGQGVAQITIPTPPAAPVQDVEVNGTSVVDGQGIANITIPTPPTIPVTDVKVNGTSVVDVNKEAQVTSYKEVTQSEYNALPDSKLTDGILYCIKDIDEGDNAYPPLIYSTEEREIGVWIDGKPVYQKVFDFGEDVSFSQQIWTNTSILAGNIGHIINAKGSNSSGTFWGILGANAVSSNYIQIMHTRNSALTIRYLCLQYTKNTDTPGSGMWTTQGAVAQHYSTNEHIIGTWIDGKPLYERTYVYDITQTLQAGDTDIINVGTDKNVIDMSIIMKNKVNGRTYKMGYASVGSGAVSHNVVFYDNGYLQIRIVNDSWGTKYCMYATLQYTKTTD